MIVDDNPQTTALMSHVIFHLGHEPVSINHWDEAEARLSADVPDVLLLDLRMPDIDGFQAIRRARSMPHARNLPIIVLTASPTQDIEPQIEEAGGNAVYSKPISLSDLDTAIHFFTNGWRETQSQGFVPSGCIPAPSDKAA